MVGVAGARTGCRHRRHRGAQASPISPAPSNPQTALSPCAVNRAPVHTRKPRRATCCDIASGHTRRSKSRPGTTSPRLFTEWPTSGKNSSAGTARPNSKRTAFEEDGLLCETGLNLARNRTAEGRGDLPHGDLQEDVLSRRGGTCDSIDNMSQERARGWTHPA